jgi:hypothetical protein
MDTDPPEILPALPSDAVPAHLEGLIETAKDYARGAKAPTTQRAYAADWRHYTAWCRRHDLDPYPRIRKRSAFIWRRRHPMRRARK